MLRVKVKRYLIPKSAKAFSICIQFHFRKQIAQLDPTILRFALIRQLWGTEYLTHNGVHIVEGSRDISIVFHTQLRDSGKPHPVIEAYNRDIPPEAGSIRECPPAHSFFNSMPPGDE